MTNLFGRAMGIAFVMTVLTSAALAGPGDLDLTFGTQGKVTTDFIGTNDWAAGMAIQSDGKIVVVGHSGSFGRSGINVARYNANGSLDTTFVGGGKHRFASSFIDSDGGFAVALQADGKIVIVGTNTFLDTPASLIVVRLNTDGTLDTGFGVNGSGFKSVYHTGTDWFGSAVAIQGDGKIVAGGIFIASNETWGFAAARLNMDGSLDTTFDTDGKVMVRVGNSCGTPPSFACSVEEVWKLAIQSDNKILLAGNAWNGSNQDFAMVRLNSNGSLDSNFGSGGKVKTAIGTGDDKAYALAILSDNKILLAGSAGSGSLADFALARFNADGTVDNDFGTNGMVIAPIGAGEDVATSLIVGPDGTIVVAGYSNNGTNKDYVLASYNANGSPDTSLNVNGYVVTQIGTADDMATCLAVQNGKLVVAGQMSNGSNYDFGLARYEFNLGVTPDLVRKMIPYAGGLITAFDSGLIYFSPDTFFPGGGGDTIRLYAGTQRVTEMIPFSTGVITAFSGTAIYYSPDGRRLGGGGNTIRVFNGGKTLAAMIPYQNGVITAFSQGFLIPTTGAGIYYSPDGLNLGGGGNTIQVYSGTQMVVKMIPYSTGVITAFSANWIYYSPDGLNLGGGGATTRVYSGTERVLAMAVYQNSVITAFNSGAIYNSPDGQNLGGGGNTQQVYPSGVMTPVALISHQNGVLTAFRSGTIYAVYYSPDGQDLAAQSGLSSTTEMALFSTSGVRSLIPYQSGAIIAMNNKVIIYSQDGTSFAWLFGGNPIRIY